MNFIKTPERIYALNEEGTLVAEITFPAVDENTVCIDHTFVDDSLRGQGIAGKLMSEAVTYLTENKKEITATCSYAVHWLEKNKASN